MCVSHLECVLTVISIRANTVFPGLNLLFGQLLEEVGFSGRLKGSIACYLFKSRILAEGRWPQARTAGCESQLYTVSAGVAQM